MRKVAAFKFELNDSDVKDFAKLKNVVSEWFDSKGTVVFKEGEFDEFQLNYQGKTAEYLERTISSSKGTLQRYILKETGDDLIIQTTIELTRPKKSDILVYIQLEFENVVPTNPNRLIIKKPRLVDSILSAFPKKIKEVPSKGLDFEGDDGLKRFIDLLLDEGRQYPLIVISKFPDDNGLSEDLLGKLSHDLRASAFVCRIDETIAWKISETAGKQWSCYNGAIRLFWPHPRRHNNPFHHPFMNYETILSKGNDIESISRAISNGFRKQIIMDLSPVSVVRPEVSGQIQSGAQQEAFEARIKEIRGKSKDASVYEEMIGEYEEQLQSYIDSLADRDNEITIIRHELEEARRQIVVEETEKPEKEDITTIEGAVIAAAKRLKDSLVFADRIDKSIVTLAEDAGPPHRIFECFEKLDQLSKELRSGNGNLGKTQAKWLADNGVDCSGESDTTKNNPKLLSQRKFHVANKEITFDKHIKLGNATDIKHCVRIYFEWDGDEKKFLIGYVGKHLDS